MNKKFTVSLFCSLAAMVASTTTASAVGTWSGRNGTEDIRASLSLGVQNFYWDEYDDGDKLLDETGLLYQIGFEYDNFNMRDAGTVYSVKVAYTDGSVDYDGQTQTGTPITTDTKYRGWDMEFNVGKRFKSSGSNSYDLLAGLGYDSWTRDIESTYTSGGTRVSGYEEDYTMIYLRLTGGINMPGTNWSNHVHGGVKYPLQTDEDVWGTTLNPEGKVSPFIEWRIDAMDAGKVSYGFSVYYEETRFDESDTEYTNTSLGVVGIYQPESNRKETGVRFHYNF